MTENRRPGLIGCGSVLLLLGLLALGFCGLMLVSLTMSRQQQAPMPTGMLVYVSLLYLTGAVVFGTLGLGSILARRWSRPLILILSWGWLVCGLSGSAIMMFMLPELFAGMPPEQAHVKPFVIGCVVIMFGVFGILLPGAFLLFYGRKDVKAALERLDPVPRWTDRFPTPLLAFAIWMFAGAISVCLSSFMYKALPVGSVMLRGWQGTIVLMFFALFMLWIAFGTLRRAPAAWWSAIVLLVLGIGWSVMFGAGGNYEAWSEAMSIPPDPNQAEIMRKMYTGPFYFIWLGTIWAAYLGFLLYIRRYFFTGDATRTDVPPEPGGADRG